MKAFTPISAHAFDALVETGEVLERDRYGVKVVALEANRIAKIFRRKRLISSALLRPYARRFVDNAHFLTAAGFDAPKVVEAWFCKQRLRHMVIYERLPGEPMRTELNARHRSMLADSLSQLGVLMARLHAQGVYFRSLHLGNVLTDPKRGLALIDVADMRRFRRPLPLRLRIRNFRPLLQHPDDRRLLGPLGVSQLIDAYLRLTSLSSRQCLQLRNRVERDFHSALFQ